jgi:hypothetical protein
MRFAKCAVVLVFFISLHAVSQEPEKGTICVASRKDDPFFKEEPRLKNGQVNTHHLRLRIDKQPPVEWPVSKGLEISGLDLKERHFFAVLEKNGEPIESLRFSFSGYRKNRLCLTYDGYQGIQLSEQSRKTPWCKCGH